MTNGEKNVRVSILMPRPFGTSINLANEKRSCYENRLDGRLEDMLIGKMKKVEPYSQLGPAE